MDKIIVRGGKVLKGEVVVGGSKNAALPILISSLLTEQECVYRRVPALQDIHTIVGLLKSFGCHVEADLPNHTVRIRAADIKQFEAPYDLVRKMRASVIVLGPLLARFGEAKVSLPGGCAIGARPINYHLTGLEKLGAKIELDNGYVHAKAKRLQGNRVRFEFPSVGATENIMMAAALAKGESILENCAKEPEIVDLADALNAMGAQVSGAGSETILIQGSDRLGGLDHSIMGDRIEAGTYLAAGLITGGDVKVNGISPSTLESVLSKFEEAGSEVIREVDSIRVISKGPLKSVDLTTLPFPGFPTDMQAQFMVLMCRAQGSSVITETIFENRFMHVPELCRLGADITIRGNTALVRGKEKFKAAPLMATDLRASASLILGGLVAEGATTVRRIYHLDRGYESMEKKLQGLGANIERVKDE